MQELGSQPRHPHEKRGPGAVEILQESLQALGKEEAAVAIDQATHSMQARSKQGASGRYDNTRYSRRAPKRSSRSFVKPVAAAVTARNLSITPLR